ncbi:two-component response regulator 24-like [Telopea speciosissima]|uniref:two-component response regulator 24-like n=1 Tax=Telopea speciosissima TaxID=54955 RepID=UPI001CC478C9|nr:two-component response regulator 24-like [Telopea speciosissima]
MKRPLGINEPTPRNSKHAANKNASKSNASTSQNVTKNELAKFLPKNGLSALVVDDAYIGRIYHKILLTNLGVECRDVSNGQDAVALCREGAFFHLILMDMEMPIMSGLEATRMLREIGIRSMIIGVTAHNKEWQVREFIDVGLDGYEEKPLSYEKLIDILRDLDASQST